MIFAFPRVAVWRMIGHRVAYVPCIIAGQRKHLLLRQFTTTSQQRLAPGDPT